MGNQVIESNIKIHLIEHLNRYVPSLKTRHVPNFRDRDSQYIYMLM